ncbi:BCD family MFS transporter [Rhodobacter sp. KR11]|uniref:BCD family MFS transporter n=1 Tax=Rhodobacter sp. KR11 TaxID=2974588 RepID=UPI0022230958|nr:BCD family MFS transporter [Rhodobacter sp. KR11]MCW1920195.1 BCD family MFS transporter [Rhodobacter sp. KR11]
MLNWLQILRLGLVQMALGSVIVLTTSTLNRLMVVELGVAAALPGLLVALHYAVQMNRPNWGFRSDTKGQRTRYILGGMGALALGAFAAALGLVVMQTAFWPGLALSILAYTCIGGGVGAAGTALLALLAAGAAPARRPAAAMATWLMMIFGIAVTAGVVGKLIDPYSPARLLQIVAAVGAIAVALSALAVRGIEARIPMRPAEATPFWPALREVWSDPAARGFTGFVFLSMTAYFLQELILEPYAGLVFGFSPGQSTGLSGAQHGGVFVGMLTVGILASGLKFGTLRAWVIGGCLGSALAVAAVAALGQVGLNLTPAVVAMGFFNGVFSVAAIASMMQLAGEGRPGREGTRMGLWGAAQAIAAGFGGLMGAAAADLLRLILPAPQAFGLVFLAEAGLFVAAAALAAQVITRPNSGPERRPIAVPGE